MKFTSNDKLSWLNNLLFINVEMFADEDYDFLLECREIPYFDDAWIESFNQIETLEKENSFDIETINLIDNLREKAFKLSYKFTSNSEISSYVSDDIELIAKSFILDYEDDWLIKLIKSYEKSIFPNGKVIDS